MYTVCLIPVPLIILFLNIFTLVSVQAAQSPESVPEKRIRIVSSTEEDPEWKLWWDRARQFIRDKKYDEAISNYRKILLQKPQIEEVKWELSRAYLITGDYSNSSLLLDSLIETDPSRVDYLVTRGDVALRAGRPDKAAEYYEKVIEHEPEGIFTLKAQRGLVEALLRQDRVERALPLMEHLYTRGERSPRLLHKIGLFSKEQGALEKAGFYYRQLIKEATISKEILIEAADVLESLGQLDDTAEIWERYLTIDPDHRDIRRKAADFYLESRKYDEALTHIEFLLTHQIDRQRYLLEAGKVYLQVKGRADKALACYEAYRQEFPDGVDLSEDIAAIQLILANDLLAIVENDGVWMLWRDLAKLTPDRIGIYRAMATMLKDLGKSRELIEVLQIINLHRPDDYQTVVALASAYWENQRYDQCLSVIARYDGEKTNSDDLFRLQASCERDGGYDRQLLDTLTVYAGMHPAEITVTLEAVELAGEIGEILEIEPLVDKTINNKNRSLQEQKLLVTYLNGLVKNGFLGRASKIMEEISEPNAGGPFFYRQLSRLKEKILRYQEDLYEAEQEVRMYASAFPDEVDSYLRLTENAVIKEDLSEAVFWRDYLGEKEHPSEKNGWEAGEPVALFLNQLAVLRVTEGAEAVITRARDFLTDRKRQKKLGKNDFTVFQTMIGECLVSGRSEACKSYFDSYQSAFQKQKYFQSLETLIEVLTTKKREAYHQLSLVDLFRLCELLLDLERYQKALKVLAYIDEHHQKSERTAVMRAHIYYQLGSYKKSSELYNKLKEKYPGETFFYQRYYYSLYHDGKINECIGETEKIGKKENLPSTATLVDIAKDIASPETRRMVARALWTEGRWQEALTVYNDLIHFLRRRIQDHVVLLKEYPVAENGNRACRQEGAAEPLKLDTVFLARILETCFFAENLGKEIAVESSKIYAAFKWLKSIEKEYEAKSSLNEKQFYLAQKKYENLIDESDHDEDVYHDLATIYGRLGNYAKETEMIEKIKETGKERSALQPIVAANTKKRQPQLFTDFSFLRETGRKGVKDMRLVYNGVGINIQPFRYDEIGMNVGWMKYESSEEGALESIRLNGEYHGAWGELIESSLIIGFEKMDAEEDFLVTYDARLEAQIEEKVLVKIRGSKALVDDTLNSVENGIYRSSVGAGMVVDYVPSLFMGFDFDLIDYTDSNSGRWFDLWTSYRLFGDVYTIDFSYHYEKTENRFCAETKEIDADCCKAAIAYWSPDHYWRHLLSIEYRRELWPEGRLSRGTSHVSLQYGVGYESYQQMVQYVRMNVLLEVHPLFLLKTTFFSHWTEGYDRNEVYASLVYRW